MIDDIGTVGSWPNYTASPRVSIQGVPRNTMGPSASVPSDGESSRVTISLLASLLSSRSQSQSDSSAWQGLDFIGVLSAQIYADGENAPLLKEMPDSDDPGRLDLANQAVDFALEKGPNPFAGLPREILSGVAYDGSGAFTTAERNAAWSEISLRDVELNKKVFEQVDHEDFSGKAGLAIYLQAKQNLQIISGMSEAERSMTNLGSAEIYELQLNSAKDKGIVVPDIEPYSGQLAAAGEILVSKTDETGQSSWATLAVNQKQPDGSSINLLRALAAGKLGTPLDESDTFGANWLTLYASDGKSRTVGT